MRHCHLLSGIFLWLWSRAKSHGVRRMTTTQSDVEVSDRKGKMSASYSVGTFDLR